MTRGLRRLPWRRPACRRGLRGRPRRAAVALAAAGLLLLVLPGVAFAQSCDDFDACTSNDMCSGGTCQGSFAVDAPCDDRNPCTVDDRCVVDPVLGERCRGTPTLGLPCSGGCGTCQAIMGNPNVVTCGGDPGTHGQDCDPDLGLCVVGSCVIANSIATCVPRQKECEDTDGNKCTDVCDPQTGECAVDAPRCIPSCETCDPESGACQPANLGGACDDGDVCTPQTRCEFNEAARRTFCVAGVPNGPSPTPTGIGATPSVSPTGLAGTPTSSPTGDASTPTVSPTADGTPAVTPTLPDATPAGTATPTDGDSTPTAVPTAPGSTPTVSPTAGGETPGMTPTAADGTPTRSPGATMTVPAGGCIGDCDDDGIVVVSELVTGVNIALDRAPVGQCPNFDVNASGTVEVNELIAGVGALIGGCP